MKDYLLDTNALIWFLEGDSRLSERMRLEIENDESNVFVSVISLWEIAVKVSIGKIDLSSSISEIVSYLKETAIEIVNLDLQSINLISSLPFYHRDPFDRALIAQSLTRKLKVITVDRSFVAYGVTVVW